MNTKITTQEGSFIFNLVHYKRNPVISKPYTLVISMELKTLDYKPASTISLPDDHVYQELSMKAYLYEHHIDSELMVLGGQAFEDIAENVLNNDYYPIYTDQLFAELYALWRRYHLNAMKAGTPEQMAFIRGWIAKRKRMNESTDYREQREALKHADLLTSKLADDTPYEYGTGWLYEPIPDTTLTRIKELIASALPKDALPKGSPHASQTQE